MDDPEILRRLIGVYDADGTLAGELSYFLRARVGRAHCALCDVTHGRVRERPEWRTRRAQLPVPFETYHRDDQPEVVRAAAHGLTPVVVGELSGGDVVVLLDPEAIERCDGEPEALIAAVQRAVSDAGLSWTTPDP